MSEASATPAHKVYNIAHWSDGYIGVNAEGQVMIRPDRGHTPAQINLPELTRTLTGSGVQFPVLIRFVDILHDRVNKLCNAFNKVAEEQAYRGRYTAVYPIKVNQQRRVVEELVATEPAASRGQIGLEAGSKPELMA
ncbi:MAG: arginine decarboxylase, partial [Marinobacter sp.]|nr:arginine decarboxylase [Marinobacter sp.]